MKGCPASEIRVKSLGFVEGFQQEKARCFREKANSLPPNGVCPGHHRELECCLPVCSLIPHIPDWLLGSVYVPKLAFPSGSVIHGFRPQWIQFSLYMPT